MCIKDAIVLRFSNICRARNISINELATLSGVTPSTAYSMMDKSRRDISVRTVKKFCEGLGLTTREFYNDDIFDEVDDEII